MVVGRGVATLFVGGNVVPSVGREEGNDEGRGEIDGGIDGTSVAVSTH